MSQRKSKKPSQSSPTEKKSDHKKSLRQQLEEAPETVDQFVHNIFNFPDLRLSTFWAALFVSVFFSSLHLYMTPYTKVEESFPLQATHDILFHGANLEKYDHFEFPGVVPRTFIGSLCLAILSYPFKFWFIDNLQYPKVYALYIVRFMLGLIVSFCFSLFCAQIEKSFSRKQAFALLLLSVSQFHLFFYFSRPLPNTFALALVLLAFSYLLDRGNEKKGVITLVIVCVIFRSEAVLLLGPFCLTLLITRRVSFVSLLLTGLISSLLAIGATVLIDSIFWGRWLWPEFEVFWFNTYHNKSLLWGTQPYHWYFTSALPRALNGSLILALVGFYFLIKDHRSTFFYFFVPSLVFLFLYSFLPHKELRFIFYILPVFNFAATFAATAAYNRYHADKQNETAHTSWFKKIKPKIYVVAIIGIVVSGLILSMMILYISSLNYPGGHAIQILHNLYEYRRNDDVRVHIDVPAAMTGVSRFLELYPNWNYSKAEGTKFSPKEYDFLINSKPTISGFDPVHEVWGFDTINIKQLTQLMASPSQLILELFRDPFLLIQEKPQLYIFQKKLASPTSSSTKTKPKTKRK